MEEKKKSIYVYCLSNLVTGGVELLHQLVHELNNSHYDAYIVYTNPQNIPEEYKKYNIKIADKYIDDEDSIIVFSETLVQPMLSIRRAKIVLWWLSVDNFFLSSTRILSLKDYYRWDKKMFFKVIIYRLKKLFFIENNFFVNNVSMDELSKLNIQHCYQSAYAKSFLTKNGIDNSLPLTDYLNSDFSIIPKTSFREDNILYNPRKGYAFTKKLISALPDYNWIPLKNLSRQQLVELFQKSKLYIDFGEHPGKDRLPREAVINGCHIITGKQGAAGYYEDIPLSDYYKLDENVLSISDITNRIRNVIANYGDSEVDFISYRKLIQEEYGFFQKQVEEVFCKLV